MIKKDTLTSNAQLPYRSLVEPLDVLNLFSNRKGGHIVAIGFDESYRYCLLAMIKLDKYLQKGYVMKRKDKRWRNKL